jgi:hypothetical protein
MRLAGRNLNLTRSAFRRVRVSLSARLRGLTVCVRNFVGPRRPQLPICDPGTPTLFFGPTKPLLHGSQPFSGVGDNGHRTTTPVRPQIADPAECGRDVRACVADGTIFGEDVTVGGEAVSGFPGVRRGMCHQPIPMPYCPSPSVPQYVLPCQYLCLAVHLRMGPYTRAMWNFAYFDCCESQLGSMAHRGACILEIRKGRHVVASAFVSGGTAFPPTADREPERP